MDKRQEEKFKELMKGSKIAKATFGTPEDFVRYGWRGCLDANGIESTDEPNVGGRKMEKAGAPHGGRYLFSNDHKGTTTGPVPKDLADNPFYNTSLGESYREPINDLAKTFETLAFAITDASNKITAAVNAGIERANAEFINAEAKEKDPEEMSLLELLSTVKVLVDKEKGKATFGIPPEAKEWMPKEGDAVFVNAGENNIGIVIAAPFDGIGIRRQTGTEEVWFKGSVKPFKPSAIGKTWSEI